MNLSTQAAVQLATRLSIGVTALNTRASLLATHAVLKDTDLTIFLKAIAFFGQNGSMSEMSNGCQ